MVTQPFIPTLCWLLLAFLATTNCKRENEQQPVNPLPGQSAEFTNPVITGSDPWVTKSDSHYYYMQTQGNRISIWKTKSMELLGHQRPRIIFSPQMSAPNGANIWAPELHKINGTWYVYYTAGAGPDSTQRLWVLENNNNDPTQGNWEEKGRIYNIDSDFWAIDGTIMIYNGDAYLIWSGRPRLNEQTQNLYISKMAGPLELSGNTTMISTPEFSWEKNGGAVNEAPQVLINPAGRIYLVYSASGCWTDEYCLGLLELSDGGDPLNASDWKKFAQPVLQKDPSGNVYGPGHNAFFISPGGSEWWIIYHANSRSGEGCGDKRNIRMQPFKWRSDGVPEFITPVAEGKSIAIPK